MGIRLRIEEGRLSFPVIWEPEQYEGEGAWRYSAHLLVEPDRKYPALATETTIDAAGNAVTVVLDDALPPMTIQEAIDKAAEDKLGKKAAAAVRSWQGNAQRYCFLDGNNKEFEGYEGMWYLSAHRHVKPDPNGKFAPLLVLDEYCRPLTVASGKPYSGCYVNASVDIYIQGAPNAGARCGLRGLQFVRDGDAFGGGAPASPSEFKRMAVPEGAENDLV